MFTVIMNNGDYQEVNAQNIEQAKQWVFMKYTQEEIEKLEMSIIDQYGNEYSLKD